MIPVSLTSSMHEHNFWSCKVLLLLLTFLVDNKLWANKNTSQASHKNKTKKPERWRRGEEEEDRVRGSTNDLENCNRLLNFLSSLSQAATIFLLLLLLLLGLLYCCNKSQSSVCVHCFKMKGVGWDGSDKKTFDLLFSAKLDYWATIIPMPSISCQCFTFHDLYTKQKIMQIFTQNHSLAEPLQPDGSSPRS